MYCENWRNALVAILCLSLSGLSQPVEAASGFVSTDDYLALEDRQVIVERVQSSLLQERVSAQLAVLGVDPELARERVAVLPDSDLIAMDQRLQDMPAGAGVLELVLVVFVVMLILDLTGVTDLFPTIGPGNIR